MSKPFWQSRTFWVGIFIFVASILVSAGIVDVPLDPDAAWVGIAWGVVQTILRFITGSPVTASKK